MKTLTTPKIGQHLRHIGRLVSIETVQPPKPLPEKDYIFEDTEARCELRLHDEVLKHLGTLNDFYGEGTGIETAIKEMKEYCQKRKIAKDSDLEVVVIKVISQFRARPIDRENFYDTGYPDFERIRQYDRDLSEPTETIVWSSKRIQKRTIKSPPKPRPSSLKAIKEAVKKTPPKRMTPQSLRNKTYKG